MVVMRRLGWVFALALMIVPALAYGAGWQPHSVRRLNGDGPEVTVPAEIQIVTESWNRVVAVPYIVYMPEKDRVLMLVGCDYPHHAEVLASDDHGATWSAPRPVQLDDQGAPVPGLGVSLTYLGSGKVLMHAGSNRLFSEDYGETWGNPVEVGPTSDGKPWYIWDPLLVDRDPATGAVTRLTETGYTVLEPPEVEARCQQGYIRFSTDEGRTWSESIRVPQWQKVSEVALYRTGPHDLVAACRTDIPPSKAGEWIDHYEGLGISLSNDDGQTWSEVYKLYDYGRHHPSIVGLPGGRLVMTYVVRKGYIDTADGYPQFGIEAIVSDDNGATWDLDHRYLLDVWRGNRQGENGWWASSQATSTVLLPDGSLLTAFGTGYRSEPTGTDNHPAPRDAGLVHWRLSDAPVDASRVYRDAPADSDLRNVFDPGPKFRLEMLVDFPDDGLESPVPITAAHVDAMMATLRDMGVTRVSWGYYGDGHGGYLMPSGLDAQWQNYARTIDALGNPLKVAAEAAHRHGLECYAYYKPYETGPAIYFPTGSPEGRAYGRVAHRGGWLTWFDPFVVEHPELRIRRRPDASAADPNRPVCALKLVKRDDTPTRVTGEHLQIWTSQLNSQYQPMDIAFDVAEAVEPSPRDVRDVNGALITKQGDPVRTLTLSGFALRDPYILVTTDFTEGPADFENTGTDMLHALDADGNEIEGVFAIGNGIWEAQRVDFRTWGLIFDMGRGQTLARLDESNASGRTGMVAFARGRNDYLPGALCETEPAVQAFWLECIREMLDAGVDGIDFRVENHGTHTDYPEEYGYNQVVLDECARRGAVDAATIAQVRGEAYTQFLRDAKALIAERGKRMRINLNIDWYRPDPPPGRRLAYTMNIHYDWQRWIDEGLLDEGILRMFALPLDSIFTDAVAADMIARCEAKGIPLTVNRYINPDYVDEFTRVRADGRFGGFILYEAQTCLRFADPPSCTLQNDVVQQVVGMMKAGE